MFSTNGRYLIQGNAGAVPLADKSVHTICTSPPYWSLRRYPGAQDRPWPAGEYSPMPGAPPIPVEAWTGPLGLEPTPELFIWHLVLVFRECYRVLRDDGTAWVVIGDSYAGGAGGRGDAGRQICRYGTTGGPVSSGFTGQRIPRAAGQLQQGDLVGIPHRLQFALQADGWIVRNDVVWHKTNPMPESVSGWRWERCRVKLTHKTFDGRQTDTDFLAQQSKLRLSDGTHYAQWQPCPGCPKCEDADGYVLRRGSWRHTRAHETVLHCVKQMGYFSNQEAVREAASDGERFHGNYASGNRTQNSNGRERSNNHTSGRNPRSVLTPRPEFYHGKHYAAYPTSLIAPLIRASCPARCCPECGAGWAPVVERGASAWEERKRIGQEYDRDGVLRNDLESRIFETGDKAFNGRVFAKWKKDHPDTLLGYRPTCDCNAPHKWIDGVVCERCHVTRPDHRPDGCPDELEPCYVPGLVFDPFLGSGTTLKVAKDLMLRGIGLDLSHSYLDEQAKVRASVSAPSTALDGLPLFTEATA